MKFIISKKHTSIIILFIFNLIVTKNLTASDMVGMVTGSEGGTYFKMGNDISRIIDPSVKIKVKTSKGSMDNIKRLASRENAGFAIVQSDVMQHLKNHVDTNPEYSNYIDKLRLIYPLHLESVHVFSKKSISSLEELSGKKVAIGELGSGTNITANNILDIYSLDTVIRIESHSNEEALKKLINGDLDAVFFVGGKPLTYFERITEGASENKKFRTFIDKLHFLSINPDKLLGKYIPSKIYPEDYSTNNYSLLDSEVNTVSTTAMLVSYNFGDNLSKPYFKKRCEQIKQIAIDINKNLLSLKSSGHKRWRDVELDRKDEFWKTDKCVFPDPDVGSFGSPGLRIDSPPVSAPDESNAGCYLGGGKDCG